LQPEKFHGIQTRRWVKTIVLRKFIGSRESSDYHLSRESDARQEEEEEEEEKFLLIWPLEISPPFHDQRTIL
jgi:hypothetical protein